MSLNDPQNDNGTGSGSPAVPWGYAEATRTVQHAFEKGWIDIDEFDRRLQGIANSSSAVAARAFVSDLDELAARSQQQEMEQLQRQQVVERQEQAGKGFDLERLRDTNSPLAPFFSSVGAFGVCTLIWALVAVSSGPGYFWPMWLLIPVAVTGVKGVINQRK